MNDSALLALEDGTTFLGTAIGYSGHTVGELIFNTATTGYQEIITDPSYAQQIVTFTYPHIGNVGTNQHDCESDNHCVAGIVVRDLSIFTSNWRSEHPLSTFLKEKRIVGIAGIDTRQLTHILREQGAQRACITHHVEHPELAIQAAKECPSLVGTDLAKQVSTPKMYHLGSTNARYHIVAYDFGIKQNILRLLVERQARVTVVPAQTPVEEVLAMQPDGVFLSNGPGDPAACDYAVATVPVLLQHAIPLFGICLGHQLLALGCGGQTVKMKFGHHGANHPVTALEQKNKVLITSQNHGFTVDEASLPEDLIITHRSLFDNTIQGIRHSAKPAFGFQGHPEASPGPHDAQELFDQFIQLIEQKHHAEA